MTSKVDRDIILVMHSLGGLVGAQALVLGHRATEGYSTYGVAKHLRGLIFMGTPFGGSKAGSWGDAVRRLWSMFKAADNRTLGILTLDSSELKDVRAAFPEIIRQRNTKGTDRSPPIGVVFFYEMKKTWKIQASDDSSLCQV